MSLPPGVEPLPFDPQDRCSYREGQYRCVLRPHERGDHVLLVHEIQDIPVGPDAPRDVCPPVMVRRVRPPLGSASVARARGFTGDSCQECGMFMMVRAGVCLKCMNCGSTSGGCS